MWRGDQGRLPGWDLKGQRKPGKRGGAGTWKKHRVPGQNQPGSVLDMSKNTCAWKLTGAQSEVRNMAEEEGKTHREGLV